jgi:TldD protein|tara:strand:+ start:2612 stop:3997 length:1386 start_codon:yes stop_codon:yes gene_type:complete
MLNKDIRSYSAMFPKEYTELRVQENRSNGVALLNGDVVSNGKSAASGVSARIFKDGHWGFASNPNISDDAVESVIRSSTDNVRFLNKRDTSRCGIMLPETFINYEKDFTTSKQKNSQKHWIDFLKALDDYIVTKHPKITSRTVVIRALDMEKSLLIATGSTSYSMTPRAHLMISLSADRDGQPVELMEAHGGLGQLEDNFDNPQFYFSMIDEQVEHLLNKVDGVYAVAGEKEVILDAELAGILAHEAIGHTTEADLVMGGSVAGDYMGQQVASSLVSLIDFANNVNDVICPVPVYVDDEGTKSEDVTIIENGVLKNFMHNKDSARHFESTPTGNARAFAFSDEPLIRMRNTAIMPGESKLEEMIASVEDGYYLMKPGNGQADSTSEFMFAVNQGYEIKNGKLGKALMDTTISGVAFDMLKTVDMVSDDMTWVSSGMCGKKQPMPVGMGGPAIRCKVNIGGR